MTTILCCSCGEAHGDRGRPGGVGRRANPEGKEALGVRAQSATALSIRLTAYLDTFDIHEDQKLTIDDDGIEFAALEEVRTKAQRILPDLAREEIPGDGDRRTYVVLVRAEDGTPIYSATLAFAGLWLQRTR